MTHDEIIRQLDRLMATYEQAAARLADIDALDDEYWPIMRELRAIETKFEALMPMATAPIDRWFVARDDYLASNNRAAQGSGVE